MFFSDASQHLHLVKQRLSRAQVRPGAGLHSQLSYCASHGFRPELLGEPQERQTSELDPSKYPSVTILKYSEKAYSEKSKWMVAMNTEDILKFMLSDFVRKGVFDQIFDKEVDWTGPPELVTLMQGQVAATAAL